MASKERLQRDVVVVALLSNFDVVYVVLRSFLSGRLDQSVQE